MQRMQIKIPQASYGSACIIVLSSQRTSQFGQIVEIEGVIAREIKIKIKAKREVERDARIEKTS